MWPWNRKTGKDFHIIIFSIELKYEISKVVQHKIPHWRSKQGVICANGTVPTYTSSPLMQGPLPASAQTLTPPKNSSLHSKTLSQTPAYAEPPLVPNCLVQRLPFQGNHCALCTHLLMDSWVISGPASVSFEPHAPRSAEWRAETLHISSTFLVLSAVFKKCEKASIVTR